MPVYPRPEHIRIVGGRYFTAEWYYTEAGTMPAYDYYLGLSELDQNRFDHVILLFCDTQPGILLPKTLYRVEDNANKIYAFRPGPQRFFNFTMEGAKVIVANAYRKHSNEMTRQDLEILKAAARYRADYIRRLKEGTYYEP